MKVGPWKVKSSRKNEFAKLVDEIVKESKDELYDLWRFLHVYYVLSRTFKAFLYFSDSKTSIDLYFFPPDDYLLIRPRFIPREIISKISIDDLRDRENCKEIVLAYEYNRHFFEGLNDHFCNLKCDECELSITQVIDNGMVYIGLYKVLSMAYSEKKLMFLEAISDLSEETTHDALEYIYNRIFGKLLEGVLNIDGLNVLSNVQIEFPIKVYSSDTELDLVLEKDEKLIVFEITSHQKREDNSWKEHFKKKSAMSNILIQSAYSKGWKMRYVYFYSHGFGEGLGTFNFKRIDHESPFLFVPYPMWDFEQFKFLRGNFSEFFKRRSPSRDEWLCKKVESVLENLLKGIIAFIRCFFEDGVVR